MSEKETEKLKNYIKNGIIPDSISFYVYDEIGRSIEVVNGKEIKYRMENCCCIKDGK